MATLREDMIPRNEAKRRAEAVRALPTSPLFAERRAFEGFLSFEQRALRSLRRAQAIVNAYNLSAHDVEALTQPFWDCHMDPAMAMDSAAGTLVTIQVNLAAGTLVKHVHEHPSHWKVLQDILGFRVIAHYLLTEVAHGLDAINIETTATALPDGGYELHCPNPGAAKIMPPTAPCGIPAVGIVFAKLIVDGKNHGIRAFLLPFNDGTHMSPGISCKLMPPRGGSNAVFHSITYFDHVHLAPESLLGGRGSHAQDERVDYIATIWRTAVGALALASGGVSFMQRAAYIAGRLSLRRMVGAPSGGRIPIITFRTQHAPILTTLAWSFVAKEFWKVAIEAFSDESIDYRVRHGWATVYKATVIHQAQTSTLSLASRCGAQGIFNHNDIIELHSALLGVYIAEGDILGLCIRLASELLLGRYKMPSSKRPTSLLAQHEKALLLEGRTIMANMKHHRSDAFNRLILPKCEGIVRAIGARMAYDAALDAQLDPRIVDLYVASVIKQDAAWYVEHGLSRAAQDEQEDAAVAAALPCLQAWMDATGVERYVQVPISSQRAWDAFVDGLQTFTDVDAPAYALNDGGRVAARL